MAVHAHPDDESSKGAATYAYYLDRGVEVMVVSCTSGERGSILNEGLATRPWAERDMTGLRRVEMAAAQAAVGFEHRWLGYADSGLPENDDPLPANAFAAIAPELSVRPLVHLIREQKPQVLLTYDEKGGYPHPDHIRCHDISVLAYRLAADETYAPELGPAWQVSKLYYDRIFSYQRMQSIKQLLEATDPDSPLLATFAEMGRWMTESPYLATTQIPAGAFFESRDNALLAHASQVSPDSAFFFWPNELQQQAWPYEDYQLIDSKVPLPEPVEGEFENDFFAGIDSDVLSEAGR
ncbi:mycothiol conjugate amidase Mca [Subtercola boreus]|uniref:Mycothiol S-conjugate amidase n=1 Tax=Subtercola boreus TaxID=120213 RepID=A0A3E0WAC9_9MICO|nr:mycothiol conjugate amidase Mca [Subtercola boreus]RFA20034.1 mycothiol conjugate amidase Mca [Subtercola boreus]RFA20163.1 mycothiol conjugate amidase Mca [Subtercola boreus]RFA26490.1 mycothiol conjugate amidase Mca [Subtercola boreus]